MAQKTPTAISKETSSIPAAVEGQDQKDLMDGLAVTEDNLLEAREMAGTFSLAAVRKASEYVSPFSSGSNAELIVGISRR